MKRVSKIFLSVFLTLVLVLIMTSFTLVSADGTIQQSVQVQNSVDGFEMVVPVDKNGNADLYVTFRSDENGVLKQSETSSTPPIETNSTTTDSAAATSDIAVTFHVSLKNWTGQYGDVSWSADSNQPNITAVWGSVFVKSTSILFPVTYFSKYFEMLGIGGQIHAGDYLGYADLGSETAVRVSFSSVVITTIQMVCPMANTSMVVYKP